MSEQFNLTDFLKNLPNLPGVYRMFDKAGQVLYVGKAVNLKNRVKSYFQKNDHSPRIALMIKQIHHIEVSITHSEAEALILENNLIKALSPKYNILFRDDKSYPYLKFSAHTFPQIAYYRGNLKKPHHYFGPYPNSQAVRESIHTLQKVFRLRTCEDSVLAHRERPCLLYQIHRCSAPCVDKISPANYQQDIQQALDFLNGKTDDIQHKLNEAMNQAADSLLFEEAARLRDQLQALHSIQSQQWIDGRSHVDKNIDTIAAVSAHGINCIHWVSIRAGRRVADSSFFPLGNTEESTTECGEAFIAQHYLRKDKPDILISNFAISTSLQAALNSEAKRKIHYVSRPQGERRVWLKMAEQNGMLSIEQKTLQSTQQIERQQALAEVMKLPEIQRLECFDISHTFGEATVASCVVYDNNTMQPSQYRRFNIQTAKKSDDYGAMKEALSRRYRKLADNLEDAPPRPDVVVIDGGKGQISTALAVWQDLGLDIPLIGVAKGPERKVGKEELILPQGNEVLHLAANHPALLLLQTVRDEAHRFAITGHRKKRAKSRTHSRLDDITGIGAKRKKALLTRFGSVRGIQAAALDELARTEGISHALAEKIYQNFHT